MGNGDKKKSRRNGSRWMGYFQRHQRNKQKETNARKNNTDVVPSGQSKSFGIFPEAYFIAPASVLIAPITKNIQAKYFFISDLLSSEL